MVVSDHNQPVQYKKEQHYLSYTIQGFDVHTNEMTTSLYGFTLVICVIG